ncbi:hypothetical protein IWW38_004324 [Coemansia aciculifera]|uniref:Uncharacterized protein n=1 Tax=Coemansia aciculifera TaxID=417176 RepID=A0ACC1LZW1_9FUNG|nr:hypothetical protein IWW38_004324 [Coemansia aciculifera]
MSIYYECKDKVAIVTGGARSIGLATAQALVHRGAKVVIGDVLQSGVEVANQLNSEANNHVAVFQYCDVADSASLKSLIDLAVSHFGRFDILVNNAGVLDKPWEMDPEGDFARRCIDINVRSVIDGTNRALHYWNQAEDHKGVVVNLASMASYAPMHCMPAYAASKAAVGTYTKALANLAPKVRVNAVAPGWVDTNLVDADHIGRDHYSVQFSGLLKTEAIVEQIMRLIEDESLAGDVIMIVNNAEPAFCQAPKSTQVDANIQATLKERAANK